MEQYFSTVDEGCTDKGVEWGVIVLGHLVGLLCNRMGVKIVVPINVENVPSSNEKVDQTAVKEGDIMWYINDGEKRTLRGCGPPSPGCTRTTSPTYTSPSASILMAVKSPRLCNRQWQPISDLFSD